MYTTQEQLAFGVEACTDPNKVYGNDLMLCFQHSIRGRAGFLQSCMQWFRPMIRFANAATCLLTC